MAAEGGTTVETSVLDPRGEEQRVELTEPVLQPSVLDRTLDLGAVSWVALTAIVAGLGALALRLVNLDVWALAPGEARHAYDAFALYQGRPLEPGNDLPETAPLFLLLQAFGFFLFGTTDAIARVMPALLGVAILLVGVAGVLFGVAMLRDGQTLFGVAMLLFGVAGLLVGVAVLRDQHRAEGPTVSARLLAWLKQR